MVRQFATASALLALTFVAACKQEPAPSKAPAEQSSGAPVQPQPPVQRPEAGTPGPAERTARAVGEAIDDATITARVKGAFVNSEVVKALDIKVETEKGVVQLSGFVGTQAQIDKAVELAKAVSGVQEVQNKMSLKPR